MKLSLRSTLATFAIIATLATPVAAYMAAQSFDRLAQSSSSNQIMSSNTQNRATTLTGLEV